MTSSNKKELGLFGEMTNSRTQGRNTKDEPEHLVEMQKIRMPSVDGSVKRAVMTTHTPRAEYCSAIKRMKSCHL